MSASSSVSLETSLGSKSTFSTSSTSVSFAGGRGLSEFRFSAGDVSLGFCQEGRLPRCSWPVEWGCEVEFSSADFHRYAGEDCMGGEHIFELLDRRGVSSCVGRRDGRFRSVLIVVASSIERSLHDVRVVS
ncbi:hypothetical protein F2Q69_00042888 [Brassica cretica]|uniref:Uncharacterized protein n=1 Tax=Brassica cretica TaxID=69181 RepID=A0A8S9N8S7_BRACR|nr:hypothetical protein F2Q69_00042888 [Brassica cretica]